MLVYLFILFNNINIVYKEQIIKITMVQSYTVAAVLIKSTMTSMSSPLNATPIGSDMVYVRVMYMYICDTS